jgi:AcrR family transcriptional regulator
VPEWQPRKLPRQARSRASYDAILGGCARVLERGGYESLTTNGVAEAAGVGIGTLYDFFPNRDAIVVALAEQRLARLAAQVRDGLAAAEGLDAYAALDLLLRRIALAVAEDRALYRVLFRESKFVRNRSETRRALEAFFALGRAASERAGDRVSLPDAKADAWVISRMLAHAVLEIAWTRGEPSRERLTASLVRLTFRMLLGRDPSPAELSRAPASSRERSRASRRPASP